LEPFERNATVFIAESRKTAYLHGLAIRSSAFAGVNYHPGSLLKE
jgi:hypothetical protein